MWGGGGGGVGGGGGGAGLKPGSFAQQINIISDSAKTAFLPFQDGSSVVVFLCLCRFLHIVTSCHFLFCILSSLVASVKLFLILSSLCA